MTRKIYLMMSCLSLGLIVASASNAAASEKIAFTSFRDGNPEIYVMNVDGSNQTRLTDDPARDEQPAFSPNGSKIAFVSRRDGSADIL